MADANTDMAAYLDAKRKEEDEKKKKKSKAERAVGMTSEGDGFVQAQEPVLITGSN